MEGYDFLKMIDEEEEEKERKRIKKERFEESIAGEDEENEDASSDPIEPEYKKIENHEKPKTNRLRRPEVKDAARDEL